ncbi:8-oxoguanine deaminase [candidate division WOR-3 bacterium]|nr:8-oxoguanine deaminase [candidate division WOR-3 bacterium]
MILLKNCRFIATFDENQEELLGSDILIKQNRIVKISRSIEIGTDFSGETIDCSNHIVVPGFANTHHHMFQSLTRNVRQVQNAKLFDWLSFLYNVWSDIDEECIFYSTLIACGELLKTGCSISTDHMYLYPPDISKSILEIQFEAAMKTGIRFAPSRGTMTRGKSDGGLPPDNIVQSPETVLKDMESSIDRFHDPSPYSMTKVILAPCSPFTVEKKVMKESALLAREKKVFLHTHLAETRDEDDYCMEIYGKRPLDLMLELDWTGRDVFYAHGIWFDDRELQILSETDTGISHCPTSNMRLGSGIARIKEMKDLGIRISLGVDGSASNDSSDMLGEARNAMLLARVSGGPGALTARDVLGFACRNGARMLGFENSGTIEEGSAADLAIFSLGGLDRAGSLSDPVASLVFTGISHAADYVIVNGKVAVRKGKLTGIDEEFVADKASCLSQKLLKKVI